jgi:hypothetical protein
MLYQAPAMAVAPKEEVMRRNRIPLLAAGVIASAAIWALPGAAAAAPTSFSGTLQIHIPLKASEPFPCAGPGICGAGTLRGLGPVQITIDDDEFTEIPDTNCLSVDRSETVKVLDGSGAIVLDSTGTACFPGNSQNGPHEKSYGNPLFFDLTFSVDGAHSTGAYQGATGSGTDQFQFAGATGLWKMAGTISTG